MHYTKLLDTFSICSTPAKDCKFAYSRLRRGSIGLTLPALTGASNVDLFLAGLRTVLNITYCMLWTEDIYLVTAKVVAEDEGSQNFQVEKGLRFPV